MRWGLASDKESCCDFTPQLAFARVEKINKGGSTLLPSLLRYCSNVSVGNYPLSRWLLHSLRRELKRQTIFK